MNMGIQTDPPTDAITEEVVRMAISQITREMGAMIKRISTSVAISESDDFAAVIFSAKGELLGSHIVPYALASGRSVIASFLKEIDPSDYGEGDAYISNDPYLGAHHANDMVCVVPVFHEKHCVAFAYMFCHLMDVGGLSPGSFSIGARDCFGESFRLPFLKYRVAGQANQLIQKIIAKNTRVPALVANDLHAMTTATLMGARQVADLVSRHGASSFELICDAFLARTETAARRRIASLTPGTYEVVDWLEHNGHRDELYPFRAQLTVTKDRLAFALTGVPQTDGFINGTPTTARAAVATVSAQLLFWDIPLNEGIFRVQDLVAQSGTIVCCEEPAPVSTGHLEAGFKMITALTGLVGQAARTTSDPEIRKRSHAPFGHDLVVAFFNWMDSSRKYQVFLDMGGIACGGGAHPETDGLDVASQMASGSIIMSDIETTEESSPILYLWRRLNPDSGGIGLHRGGAGIDSAWVLHETEVVSGTLSHGCVHIPAPGLNGGYPGGAGNIQVVDVDIHHDWFAEGRMPRPEEVPEGVSQAAKVPAVRITKKQVFRLRLAGGGGWGDPLDRAPADVIHDIELMAITPQQALIAHGVIADDSAAGYDAVMTERHRTTLRRQRGAGAKTIEGSSVKIPCACGATTLPMRRTSPLAERLAEFGTYIVPMDGVLLHEDVCPQCLKLIEVHYSAEQDAPKMPTTGLRDLM